MAHTPIVRNRWTPAQKDVLREVLRSAPQSPEGNYDMLVEEGRRIAEALGPTKHNIILRNHGILTAGGTIAEAAAFFYRARTRVPYTIACGGRGSHWKHRENTCG